MHTDYKTKTQEEWNKDYYKRNSENRKEAEKKKYQEKLRADGKVSKKQEIEKRRKKEGKKLKPCWSKTLREKIYVHNLIYLLKHTNVILVF